MTTTRFEHAPVPHPHLYNAIERGLVRPALKYLLGDVRFNEEGSGTWALWKEDDAAIIAPRHFSNWDIPVMATVVRRIRSDAQIHFMAKHELDKPVMGKFLGAVGGFYVDRDEQLQPETIEHVNTVVENDGLLGIFPEGTRSKTGDLGKVRRGAAVLATRYGLPIYPVGIAGTSKSDRGRIEVFIGDPIEVTAVPDILERGPREITQIVKEPLSQLRSQLITVQDAAEQSRRYL